MEQFSAFIFTKAMTNPFLNEIWRVNKTFDDNWNIYSVISENSYFRDGATLQSRGMKASKSK